MFQHYFHVMLNKPVTQILSKKLEPISSSSTIITVILDKQVSISHAIIIYFKKSISNRIPFFHIQAV